MSLAQLKDQAAHLMLTEQRELIAFLISRQTAQDEDFKAALARKIDDKDPGTGSNSTSCRSGIPSSRRRWHPAVPLTPIAGTATLRHASHA